MQELAHCALYCRAIITTVTAFNRLAGNSGMSKLSKTFVAILAVLIVVFPYVVQSAQLSLSDEVVWHWFGNCSDAKIVSVEIILKGKVTYKSSFPMCQMRRGDIPLEAVQRQLVFSLEKESLSIFEESTNERLEGRMWEAGNEAGALILGVSFDSKDRKLLNTKHIVQPDRTEIHVVATGLIIKTYPEQQ